MDKVILTSTLDDGAQIVPDPELEFVENANEVVSKAFRAAAKYADSLSHKEAKTISPAVEYKADVAASAPEQPAKEIAVTAKPKRSHYVELSLFD